MMGFTVADATMTGVETRTSSPSGSPRRILPKHKSRGLYHPAGEGAGFAGASSRRRVDGIRVAEAMR